MQPRSFTLVLKTRQLQGRRVRFIASTADLDSFGTRIRPRGCRLERFRAAGSVPLLYNHERDPENVLGRIVEVEVYDDRVEAVGEFRQSPRADEVLELIRAGILRGCSIGFCDEVTEPAPDGTVLVVSWTLAELSVAPVQANPTALAIRSAAFTLRAPRKRNEPFKTARAAAPAPLLQGQRMNPADIMLKLGLTDGAKPEEIAAALVKYMAGADSAEDKQAVVLGVLGMLAPAPSASSASDGAKTAAAEALADEVRTLQARVAELEGQRAEADKAKAETPEQRADAAIGRGQWPIGQRAALVKQYAAGKEALLFGEGYFSQRSQRFVQGGSAAKPVIEPPSAKTGVSDIFKAVQAQIASGTGADQ